MTKEAWLELYPIMKKQSMSVLLGMSIAGKTQRKLPMIQYSRFLRCDCYNDLSSLDELFRFVRSLSKFRGLDWFAKGNLKSVVVEKLIVLMSRSEHGQTRIEKFIPEVKRLGSNSSRYQLYPHCVDVWKNIYRKRIHSLIRKFFLEEWSLLLRRLIEIAEKFGFKIGGIGTTTGAGIEQTEAVLWITPVKPLFSIDESFFKCKNSFKT